MSRLTLHQESGGPRFHLDGIPVHAGDMLELLVYDDWRKPVAKETWILGRYEYHYETREDLRAKLYVPHGWAGTVTEEEHRRGVEPSTVQGAISLDTWCQLRWPEKTPRGSRL